MGDDLEGKVERVPYQKREFCKDIPCPIQRELERYEEGSPDYMRIKSICDSSCLYSAHYFHDWLKEHKAVILMPKKEAEK